MSWAAIVWRLPTRLILAPDGKPIRWREAERKKARLGLKTIGSFHIYGTPQAEVVTRG
jgi:hypothetical protein